MQAGSTSEASSAAEATASASAAEADGDLPGGFLRETAASDSAAHAKSSANTNNTTPPSSPPARQAEASSSSPTSPVLVQAKEQAKIGGGSRRVKVYRLVGETWSDLGTGWCNVHTDRPSLETKPEALASDADLSIAGDDEDAGPWITVLPEAADAASTSSDDADELLTDVKGKGKAPPVREIWRTAMRNVMALSAADTEHRGGYARQQGSSNVLAPGCDFMLK